MSLGGAAQESSTRWSGIHGFRILVGSWTSPLWVLALEGWLYFRHVDSVAEITL